MKVTIGLCAVVLALAATGAQAEQHGGEAADTTSQGNQQMDGMAGHGGMSQNGPSGGPGMKGPRGMGGSMMPGMMMAMMDSNDDGALSLEEVQAVHERMFNMVDANDDGQVDVEEIRGFMTGGGMMSGGMMEQNSQ